MICEMKKRKYTLRKRAEQQEETRARIVDAAIHLHEHIGPANTTISAIAERAGVERLTVYRHFPDDVAIFAACSSTYMERNPLPGVDVWQDHPDPADRTRVALTAIYSYYRSTKRMWARVIADQDDVPALDPVMRGVRQALTERRDDLVQAWTPTASKKIAFESVLGHALQFTTWQSMQEPGADDESLAGLVTLWCSAIRSSKRRLVNA